MSDNIVKKKCRCDLCYNRNVETTPIIVSGDTFNACNECYEKEIKILDF